MTSKFATAVVIFVAAACISATLAESEVGVTLGVVPRTNVQACDISRIFTETFVTDYAWTVAGLTDVIKYHQDQRLQMHLETMVTPENFPADNITFSIYVNANSSNSAPPRLQISAYYGPSSNDSNDLTIYKFNVALKVDQKYYVHSNTSRAFARWYSYPLVYNSEFAKVYKSWYNSSSNSDYWKRYDWSSTLGSQDGILLTDIQDLFAAVQQDIPSDSPDAITFIFKVTALQYMGFPVLDEETKACEAEEEQVQTFDSLVENGYADGLDLAQ